jgi:hypothetical protein
MFGPWLAVTYIGWGGMDSEESAAAAGLTAHKAPAARITLAQSERNMKEPSSRPQSRGEHAKRQTGSVELTRNQRSTMDRYGSAMK